MIVEINHSQDHKENVRVNEELSVLDYKKLFEKERVEALKRKVENLELELSRWRSGEITDEQVNVLEPLEVALLLLNLKLHSL